MMQAKVYDLTARRTRYGPPEPAVRLVTSPAVALSQAAKGRVQGATAAALLSAVLSVGAWVHFHPAPVVRPPNVTWLAPVNWSGPGTPANPVIGPR